MSEVPEYTIVPFEEFHTTLDYNFDEKRNDYFKNRAIKDSKGRNSRVHVAISRDAQLVGFFTLCMHKRYFVLNLRDGPATHPVALLGQLGVNEPFRGKGVGSDLVRKAINFVIEATNYVDCVGIILDTDDILKRDNFFKKLGFYQVDYIKKKNLYVMFYPIHNL